MTDEVTEVANIESSLEAFLDEDPTLEDEVTHEKTPEAPAKEPEEGTSDEDGKVEPKEESESDSDEEEPQEEEQEESEPSVVSDDTLIDITIGGEEYEVNLAELKDGYLRNEDYVNHVQKYDAEYDKKLADLEIREAKLADELRVASVALTGDLSKYDNINWQALQQADPERYKNLRLEAMEAHEYANQVNERRKNIEAMHAQAQKIRHDAYVKSQVELAEKLIPGFKLNPGEKTNEVRDSLIKHALSLGYTQEDVLGIADARHLLLLNNSRLLTEGVVRKKEVLESKRSVKDLPPVVKPNATQARSSVDRKVIREASARLSREKTVDAAAELLMTLDL